MLSPAPVEQVEVGVVASLSLDADALLHVLQQVPGFVLHHVDHSAHTAKECDVIVLDITARGAARRIAGLAPAAPVLVWGGYLHQEQVRLLAADGARGYLSVISKRDQLVRAVLTLAAGERYFPQLDQLSAVRLTKAEDRVLRAYLLEMPDMTRADVAAALGLSDRTVKAHVANARGKVAGQVGSRGALLRALQAHGWPQTRI
ncbi:response regulator transcription factor [Flexivirga sp. ID2601S]|uniref:Response regulator transcription factor n=1 Tax=Flexivirga aerilata TaxID=1656889 RepID=A0A849AMR0_9MICO|nr:response regulator transcription factor [Flexivirga aerilata]NNG39640.1 response regulator transcription factor [Flexivirga aerilata]